MPERENSEGEAPGRKGEKESWKTGFEFKQKSAPEALPGATGEQPAAPGGDDGAVEATGPGDVVPTTRPEGQDAVREAAGEQAPAQEAPGQPPPDPSDVTDFISSSEIGGEEKVEAGEASEADLGDVTEVMIRTPPAAEDRSAEPTIAQGAPPKMSTSMPPGTSEADHGTGATAIMQMRVPSGAPGGAAPPETISNTKLAQVAVESGMTDTAAIKACLDLVAACRGTDGPQSLAEALVSQGILTEQQLRTLEQVAREGGKANLLGGYQLLEKLGEGGMGVVYKARQVALDRIVALKILPERLSKNAEFVARFDREARAAAKLDHPNVVGAIDAGMADGKYYFVMEYVEGASIEDILEETEVVPEDKAISIIIQAAQGIECAWRNNLIHRDIKPDNILITREGVAKIADLGLARETDTADATRLTQDGAAMGTPHYISPEQARGEEVDIRTDIYALGVTLYRMVTGEFPFTGRDPVSIIMARFHETPTPANEVRSDVSDEVAQVIATMMAADRELRYPDPAVLLHDLDLLATGEQPEYASSSEELRRKAMAAARSRRPGTTTIGPIFVKKRRGRERALIIGGAVIAAAVVVVALVLAFRGTEPTGQPAPPAVVPAISEEAAALAKLKRALEEEAAAFYEKLKRLFDAEDFAEVVSGADEVGAKYAATDSGPKIDSLRARAADELEKIERRLAEEAERRKRYEGLVRQARADLAEGNYPTAVGLLTQAQAIKDTQEVKALLTEARRLQYIARGKEAERAGKLAEAIGFYKHALALKHDAELGRYVTELERRDRLARRVAEGDGFARRGRAASGPSDVARCRGEWKAARTSYLGALDIAKGDERPPIEKKLASVGAEIAYLDLIAKARSDAAASKWRGVLDAATGASEIKPDETEPKELALRARRAIGPEKRIADSLGMELVLVPAGVFTMGSETGDPDERRVREVRLDAYYIGVHEVTNAQYEKSRPRHPRTEYSTGDETPVVAVSWQDADAFCEWLSEREEIEYRLPTEAEWEMAARGPSGIAEGGRTFPWGNDPVAAAGGPGCCNVATRQQLEEWTKSGRVGARAAPVGSYPKGASPFGCMDMAGNVWEWCFDWYRGDYYAAGQDSNPQGPAIGKQHVMRGGSFAEPLRSARSANRTAHVPEFLEANVGFRVVRALDPIFLEKDGGKP